MTESRFRFLVSAICITVVTVAAIAWLPWKQWSNSSHTADTKLGEYVYVDRFGKIHTNRRCSKLNYKGISSERVNLEDLPDYKHSEWNWNKPTFCPSCVSDETYEQLNHIMH